MKTSVIVGRPQYEQDDYDFWSYPTAVPEDYFEGLRMKPSMGLFAIACVHRYIHPKELSLIGFDSVLSGAGGGHHWAGERMIVENLDMEIKDLGALH